MMSSIERNAGALAWATWGVAIALAVGSVVFLVLGWSTQPPAGAFGFRGFAAIFALTFGTVGAIVASRLPRNPIGWLFLAGAVLSGFQEMSNEYAIWAVLTRDRPAVLGTNAAWVPAWIWLPGTSVAMLTMFVFPDGHVLSPRWRWALGVGLAGTGLSALAFAFAPGPLQNFAVVENPFGIEGASWLSQVASATLGIFGVGFLLAGVSAVLRFRRSTGEERQQMRWLVAAGVVLAVVLVVSFVSLIANPEPEAGVSLAVSLIVIGGFMSLPVAMGVAILRYRLYDLDVVIRKTVVFGILVGLLTVVFLVVAIVVGGTIARPAPGASRLPELALAFAIGASTLPLWRLARGIADRLVFGGRSTPYEVLAEFAGRVSETYAAEDVSERMAAVLGSALGALEATVWLRIGDGYRLEAGWPADAGSDDAPPPDLFEVRHQGEILGALGVRQSAADPMSPAKEHLARDLAAQAGPVLRNVRLIEELRESRRRIVATQDERAKKLERDIHDGAQQQLVALTVKARLVESLMDKDEARARTMIGELQTEASEALENLRDLARGIYPPLLADQGLVTAIEAQARKAPVPVRVEASDVGRYVSEVESAVYFVVLEALQNVTKYAAATEASVTLDAADGVLRFVVADDGAGFDPATATRGSGLQGMRDRLAAVGGELEITSAPGSGATVSGQIRV